MASPDDLTNIDRALRAVDRPLWLLTAASGERRGGLLATFVVSLSLDRERPLLGAAIDRRHATHALIAESGAFIAHLLRREQTELAFRFGSTSSRDGDKFEGLTVVPAPKSAAPRLNDCLSWMEAHVVGSIDLGGRTLFVGELTSGDLLSDEPPLSEKPFIAAASDAQRGMLKQQRTDDALDGRAELAAWLQTLGAGRAPPLDVG